MRSRIRTWLVRRRINRILNEVGLKAQSKSVFSGNVELRNVVYDDEAFTRWFVEHYGEPQEKGES